eukprot:6783061-Prymnesium_polylepis.1
MKKKKKKAPPAYKYSLTLSRPSRNVAHTCEATPCRPMRPSASPPGASAGHACARGERLRDRCQHGVRGM